MIDQTDNVFDLNAVLHPGTVFDHPRDVVADATLSVAEKRSILASWASDAAAVTSNPALRELAGTRRIVTIDEILERSRCSTINRRDRRAASRCGKNRPHAGRWPRRLRGALIPKKVRPPFGGRVAAREPVWDGEGWGCDRLAGS